VEVVGVDISARFVELATETSPPGATFVRADARHLDFDAEFDAAISLCQGAFGLVGREDGSVLAGMARAVRPGGVVALTASSSYFAVRHLEAGESFDATHGVVHEQTAVRNEAGDELPADLWTTCFTPRELRLLAAGCGLEVEDLWSVSPGAYGRNPPDVEHPEFLLVARVGRSDAAVGG
jgi:SAM-dependent methyltransferase